MILGYDDEGYHEDAKKPEGKIHGKDLNGSPEWQKHMKWFYRGVGWWQKCVRVMRKLTQNENIMFADTLNGLPYKKNSNEFCAFLIL